MKTIQGTWYDGKTSHQVPAIVEVDNAGRCFVLDASTKILLIEVPVSEVQIPSRIGRAPRFLSFPCSGKFETSDHGKVDGLMAIHQSGRYRRWIHSLESRKSWVLLAFVVVITMVFGAVRFGVPATAKRVAFLLPTSIGDLASDQALSMLDKSLLSPSELEDKHRKEILQSFMPVLSSHSRIDITIKFRRGGSLGANAFALPSGTIIFTDEMVRIAKHNEELTAVLSHEIGHVVHRHGLRMLIQDSLLAFIAVLITGDASGVAEIFLSLPIVLTERAYSRGFEEEADQYTRLFLNKEQIPLCRFASLLLRIEEERFSKMNTGEKQSKKDMAKVKENKWLDYLSTHPDTSKRIEQFHSPGCE
jgi:peptidase M48-like protein